MGRTTTVSDSIVVAADPGSLYDRVSDPTQMGTWSPENRGARVSGAGQSGAGQSGTYVGMTFVGKNRRGGASWVTECVVTAADPGERFAFRVYKIGVKKPRISGRNASWEYRFESVPEGTRVTETWTDDRTWPDWVAAAFDKVVTRGSLFADFQRRNIATTLATLKAEFEKDASS